MTSRFARVVLIAALSGIFLLGSPCGGGPTAKTFNPMSIVIPMDNCYQARDTSATTETVQCNNGQNGRAGRDDGIFRAYGFAYYLIKHGITVYWTINPNKTSFVGSDVTIGTGGSNIVTHWDWTNQDFSATYFQANTLGQVTYIGAPFIIDGADAPTVVHMLTVPTDPAYADFAQFRSEKILDIHQISIGFTAQQVRPLVGPPPRVAIFNFTNANSDTTSMTVMHNYVVAAGLDTPNCVGGAAGDCAGGTTAVGGCNTGSFGFKVNSGPGKLYDILCDGDFIPPYNTSTLSNGYRLLWTPHWDDVFDPNGASGQDKALAGVLQVVSDFVDAGNNTVTECQGIQSLEGGNDTCSTGSSPGLPATRFQTTTGLNNNENVNFGGALTFSNYPSPNMQIGDFAYSLVSGCLTDWGPTAGGGYKPGVTHFITAKNGGNAATDVFTMDNKDNNPSKGLVVYLGGHDYNGQTAGTRLVLNSLFNLGIACVSPNTPCNTGLLGVCAAGTLVCAPNGGLSCVQNVQPTPEICDGLDNNCNGLIDEGLTQGCYSGPNGTDNVGVCHGGTSVCSNGVWGPCQGQKLPATEICNGLDDDCDGHIDNIPGTTNPLSQACYDGPPGTLGVGTCTGGNQLCISGSWGACQGEILPQPESCNGIDTDCDGVDNDGCGACQVGQTQPCYDGPPNTRGVGICHAGTQPCVGGGWGTCQGEVLPQPEQCNGKDNDCDGDIDNGPCPPGFQCNNGACVPQVCGGEIGECPAGYTCTINGCVAGSCGDAGVPDAGGICQPGLICQNGNNCIDPCAGVKCGAGDTCSAGQCVSAICYLAGCPDAGFVCLNGACIPDPCTGVNCPAGTFCRNGDCIQNCAYQQCDGGTACSVDGFCEPVSSCSPACGSGQACDGGQCMTDPCAGLLCGKGQVCVNGNCVDDPCTDAKCPFGKCVGGQCQGAVPLVDGGLSGATFDGGNGGPGVGVKKGCGCGSSSGFEAMALLALMGLMWAGRRSRA
jgi:hypothetical protein